MKCNNSKLSLKQREFAFHVTYVFATVAVLVA